MGASRAIRALALFAGYLRLSYLAPADFLIFRFSVFDFRFSLLLRE